MKRYANIIKMNVVTVVGPDPLVSRICAGTSMPIEALFMHDSVRHRQQREDFTTIL